MTILAESMVRRYERRVDAPDDYTYDILWVDRLTGKVVFRYDGADPANTNPYYGGLSDEQMFERKGLDIWAEISLTDSTVPVDPGEAANWTAQKAARAAQQARRAQREQEEAEAQDLIEFLGNAATDFDFSDWHKGEEKILKPALQARGFKSISFYMIEEDSFGPLIRGCVANDSSGERVRFYYG